MKKYSSEQIEYLDRIPTFSHGSIQNDLHAYFFMERDENDNIIEQSPVMIVALGMSYPDPHYHIERTGRPHYILEYVTGGVGYVEAYGKKYTVKKGDVYILEPNTVHRYYSDPHDPYSKLWINFRSEIFTHAFQALGLNGITHFPAVECEELFQRILALEKLSPYNREVTHDALELLLSIASRLAKSRQETHSTVPSNIYSAKRMLDTSLYGKITIEEVCAKLFVSRSYLIKTFKEHYGVTPHKYLLNAKLRLAANLLAGTKSSIKEIADALGFYDEYHFSKAFKTTYHVSPTAYRDKHLRSHLPG